MIALRVQAVLVMTLLNFFCKAEEPKAPTPDKKAPAKDANLEKERTGGGKADDDWSLLRVEKGSKLAINGQVIQPAGTTVNMAGSPRSLALGRGGRYLLAKSSSSIAVIDTETFKVVFQDEIPLRKDPKAEREGGSMHGLSVAKNGTSVYFTGQNSTLHTATLEEDGKLTQGPVINLGTSKSTVYPLGVGLFENDTMAVVALSIANQVAIVDLKENRVANRIDVGVCPYGVVVAPDQKTAFVSNFGGPRPRKGDRVEKTAGTDVAVDDRSVVLRGSVSVVDLVEKKVLQEIETRIHPESMTLSHDGKTLYVVDDSGDGVNVISVEQRKSVAQWSTKPQSDMPYGSLTTGIAVSPDGATLFAANAGNNAVVLLDAKNGAPVKALIPCGGYPGSVCVTGKNLFIGNVDGFGGDLQKVVLSDNPDDLKKWTESAGQSFHMPEILRAVQRKSTGVKPMPVPLHYSEPSLLKHVVYIIKENKKFDQLLGDIGRGRCDPRLCEFPRNISPNSHALADQFVLLDNYYCCSGNSSSGHQWAVQGLVTPYRSKGDGPRVAYDFGSDPLTIAGCGFIWDHALRKGVSFRNFGELDFTSVIKGKTWKDFYDCWKNKDGSAEFKCVYNVEVLRKYSDLRFPGWEMRIPDQVRADAFLTALSEFETAGKLPELIVIYLPNDHTEHTKKDHPTPRAYVADNDLALGRIVEGLSKSKFWKNMVIFANEDDPQTGTDHVSGYRSVCYVASPYAKRGALISRFYNQSSVLHTICNILGIPPMNQNVASVPLMHECFQEQPDYTPFVCLPAGVPLDEMNPDPKTVKSKNQAALAPQTINMNFSRPDMLKKNEIEIFSRYVWSTVKGDEPFPAEFAGTHGKGLAELGLTLESIGAEADDDDDD